MRLFIVNKLCVFLLVTLCYSCEHRTLEDHYLYDQIGFSPKRRPKAIEKEVVIKKTLPQNNYNGYYGGGGAGVSKISTFPQAPKAGGSRFYTNPYEIPQGRYQKIYDADRFYVPPNSYRYIEKDNY